MPRRNDGNPIVGKLVDTDVSLGKQVPLWRFDGSDLSVPPVDGTDVANDRMITIRSIEVSARTAADPQVVLAYFDVEDPASAEPIVDAMVESPEAVAAAAAAAITGPDDIPNLFTYVRADTGVTGDAGGSFLFSADYYLRMASPPAALTSATELTMLGLARSEDTSMTGFRAAMSFSLASSGTEDNWRIRLSDPAGWGLAAGPAFVFADAQTLAVSTWRPFVGRCSPDQLNNLCEFIDHAGTSNANPHEIDNPDAENLFVGSRRFGNQGDNTWDGYVAYATWIPRLLTPTEAAEFISGGSGGIPKHPLACSFASEIYILGGNGDELVLRDGAGAAAGGGFVALDLSDSATTHVWSTEAPTVEMPAGGGAALMLNQKGFPPEPTGDQEQPTPSLQPLITDVNGVTALDFDGSTWMADTASENSVVCTIALALQIPATPVDGAICMSTTTSLLNKPLIEVVDSATTPKLAFGTPFGTAFTIEPDGDWDWGEPMVIVMTWTNSGDVFTAYINGVTAAKGTGSVVGANNYAALTLGANADATSIGTHKFMCACTYLRVLSESERDDLADWMLNEFMIDAPGGSGLDGILSVAGNRAPEFAPDRILTVANSTSNDGVYTSLGAVYIPTEDITNITVAGLTDSTPDGDITTTPGAIVPNVAFNGVTSIGKGAARKSFVGEPLTLPPGHSVFVSGSTAENVDVTIVGREQKYIQR